MMFSESGAQRTLIVHGGAKPWDEAEEETLAAYLKKDEGKRG